MNNTPIVRFDKPVIVYLPCYNCATTVVETLRNIPSQLSDQIECVVVDNCSPDNTSQVVKKEAESGDYPFRIVCLRPMQNLGYAGSQKLLYHLATQNPAVKHIMLLHGDGQYPSHLIADFIQHNQNGYAIVNGFRSKGSYPDKEETPWSTYSIIKVLSAIESFLLTIPQKEWHSGMVMYSTDFLRRVPLSGLSGTMHIDGEFLMCVHLLKMETKAIPIYKKYRDLTAFEGWQRIKHVLNVFRLIFKYHRGYYSRIVRRPELNRFEEPFEVICDV